MQCSVQCQVRIMEEDSSDSTHTSIDEESVNVINNREYQTDSPNVKAKANYKHSFEDKRFNFPTKCTFVFVVAMRI